MHRRLLLLTAVPLLLQMPDLVCAQPSGDAVRWAVVIGIDNYDDKAIHDLKYAVADATAIHQVLTAAETGGFEPAKTKLLTDKSGDAPTRRHILRALGGLENAPAPQDMVLVYFSGHGIEEQGENYLIPKDGEVGLLEDTAISLTRFMISLTRCPAKKQVIILDCCHSGVDRARGVGGAMTEEMAQRVFEEAEGRIVLSSCDIGELAYEWPEKGHGVFSYYLLEALRGHADLDSDFRVTAHEAILHTTGKVVEWAFQHNRKQNPRQEYYRVKGDIVLSHRPKSLKLVDDETTPPEPTIGGGPITLGFRDTHVASVLYQIQKQADVKVTVEGDVDCIIPQIELVKGTVEDALAAVCRDTDLAWAKAEDGYVIRPKGHRRPHLVSVIVANKPFAAAAQMIADRARVKVRIEGEREVTIKRLELERATINEALTALCTQAGATWRLEGAEYIVGWPGAPTTPAAPPPAKGEEWVYFTVAAGARGYDLWRARPDGSDCHQFTQSGDVAHLAATRDGRFIYYTTRGNDVTTLFRMSADASKVTETAVFREFFLLRDVRASDGLILADTDNGVTVFDPATKAMKVVRPKPAHGCCWSADGQRIIYTQPNVGLWECDETGGDVRQLGDRPDYGPQCSPDGRWVVGGQSRPGDQWEVLLLERETGTTRWALGLVGGEKVHEPVFSPDGTKLVFVPWTKRGGLYTCDAMTGENVRQIPGVPNGCWQARWVRFGEPPARPSSGAAAQGGADDSLFRLRFEEEPAFPEPWAPGTFSDSTGQFVPSRPVPESFFRLSDTDAPQGQRCLHAKCARPGPGGHERLMWTREVETGDRHDMHLYFEGWLKFVAGSPGIVQLGVCDAPAGRGPDPLAISFYPTTDPPPVHGLPRPAPPGEWLRVQEDISDLWLRATGRPLPRALCLSWVMHPNDQRRYTEAFFDDLTLRWGPASD